MGTREAPLSNYFDLQSYGRPAFVHILTMIYRSAVFFNDTVTVCKSKSVIQMLFYCFHDHYVVNITVKLLCEFLRLNLQASL